MTIKSWPKTERPRERMLKYGVDSLSNAELLAIFLRTGTKGKSAIDLSMELLTKFETIDGLLNSTLNEFCEINGLGPAKYCQIMATLELVRRNFETKIEESDAFCNPDIVETYLLNQFRNLQNEKFACLYLNTKNRMIDFEFVFNGSINQAQVYPRVIVQNCLEKNAAAVIFAHNHPSGDLVASKSDILLTKTLKQTLKLIDVNVLDHFIVTKNKAQSMAQQGLL